MKRRPGVPAWPGSRLRTIRVRLTLWYVALLSVILVIFSAFLYLRLAQNLRDETDQALALEARQIEGNLHMNGRAPLLHDALEHLPPGMVVVLYDQAGVQLEASTQGNTPPRLPAPAPQRGNGRTSITTDRLPEGDWRTLTTPVKENGTVVGLLQVAQPEEPTETALRQLALLMGFGAPLTIILASAGGLFLASRALDPIDRITRMAQRIGAEDLSQRLGLPPGEDEVARLASTFDDMLDRLDQAFIRERQFTADASHELRTPLAVLTAQADLALEHDRRPAEYRRALREIQDEAQRMSRLLSELLVLARSDSGRDDLEREPLDLARLAADTVATLAPLAEASGVALAVVGPVPAPVLGDQTRLTQLVINLVDNALKYTPEGGSVYVNVAVDAGQAVLQVRDTGVGIAAEHLPHLFERFYRVDAARSRDEGGAGLGLAIAEWIVRAHHGAITAASALGGGTTFTVRLPLNQSARTSAKRE